MAHTGQLVSGNPLPDWNDEFQVMAEKFIMLLSQGFAAGGGGGLPVAASGFDLPLYDDVKIEYYGSTDNIHFMRYYKSGVQVATLTWSYVNGGVANDDLVSEIEQS